MTFDSYRKNLGKILKSKRLNQPLTIHELSLTTGVSSSHLSRIEKGERYPSASVLKKLATPLGFQENELFTLAGYLTAKFPTAGEKKARFHYNGIDPNVARVLSQETPEVQRAVIGLLAILKNIAPTLQHPNC